MTEPLRTVLAGAIDAVTGRSGTSAADLDDEAELADLGVTSLHAFRLMGEVEDRLGVAFDDGELDLDRFRTVAAALATMQGAADRAARR